MDPNACLAEIRSIIEREGWDDVRQPFDRLVDLCSALDDWLSKGGFEPDAWREAGTREPSSWDERPDIDLDKIRRIVRSADHLDDVESAFYTLLETIAGLDKHLSSGGFAPEAWSE